MPGHDADLSLLIDAAQEAGAIARRFFRKSPETWDKGDDDPVTEADLAIDRMLRSELTGARPGYGWLSEETEDDGARLQAERVFIVDPIDGTRAFIEGNSAFSHSISVVERGRPVAGVVYLPMQDKMFAASLGAGAALNGAQIRASDPTREAGATVLTTKANLNDSHWPGGVPPVERKYRPSLAYRIALVGTGRFDGMATFRATWEWDVAAGAVIASEAGAVVSDGLGHPITLNNRLPQVRGLLVAGPRLHRHLLARRAA